MGAIVVGMVVILVVAIFVITTFSAEDEDWSVRRPGRKDPGESDLDDLLG